MDTLLTRNWLEKVADACARRRETGADAAPAAPDAATRPGDIMSDEQRVFGARYRSSVMGTVHAQGIKLPGQD